MNLYDLVIGKVKDSAGKLSDPDDFTAAIAEALNRYSRHRPLILVKDLVGSGANDVVLPVLWQPSFSGIQAVEFPLGLIPETLLDPRDYKLYQTPTGQKLRLLTVKPTVLESVRLTFTSRHLDETTVMAADLEALANLAASVCCRQLAIIYGGTSDPTIQADTVNYRTKSGEYTTLANKLEAQYNITLGIKDNDTTPAASAVAKPPASTRARLTHGRG